MVSAAAGVLLLLTSLLHTKVSTNSGVLLLSPGVPVFCCASKGPAAAVVTAAVYVLEILSVARISAVAAVPHYCWFPSAASVSSVAGVPAVAIVYLLLLAVLKLVAHPLLLISFHIYDPSIFNKKTKKVRHRNTISLTLDEHYI